MSLTTYTAQVCGHKLLLVLVLVVALTVSRCSSAARPPIQSELDSHHPNPFPWHLKPCNYTWECQIDANFHCDSSVHLCKCEHGYELDRISMKCIKNRECVFNFNCGEYAFCHQSRCRCQLGYVPKNDDENNCRQMKCIQDLDCYLWTSTKCDIYGRCSCKSGYEKSWMSETCLKIDNGNMSYNFLAQNVFTIVIISNFLLWLSIFIFILQYAKKRRLAAAEAAAVASSSSMRRALPPGMPPPPPAYDNIGFESANTFPPPPPYTPAGPNNKTPTSQLPVVSIIAETNDAEQPPSTQTTAAPNSDQVVPNYPSISHSNQ